MTKVKAAGIEKSEKRQYQHATGLHRLNAFQLRTRSFLAQIAPGKSTYLENNMFMD